MQTNNSHTSTTLGNQNSTHTHSYRHSTQVRPAIAIFNRSIVTTLAKNKIPNHLVVYYFFSDLKQKSDLSKTSQAQLTPALSWYCQHFVLWELECDDMSPNFIKLIEIFIAAKVLLSTEPVSIRKHVDFELVEKVPGLLCLPVRLHTLFFVLITNFEANAHAPPLEYQFAGSWVVDRIKEI